MSKYPCRKKQKEVKNGQAQNRCTHKDAEWFKEVVTDDHCAACPLRDFVPLPIVDPPCDYRANGNFCSATGLTVDQETCNRCDQEAAKHSAGIADKASNYALAIKQWVANGRPVRSDEEVERIYNEHCKPCEKNVNGACDSCGCKVSSSQTPLTNKIKMKTEVCPLGRWH